MLPLLLAAAAVVFGSGAIANSTASSPKEDTSGGHDQDHGGHSDSENDRDGDDD